MERDEQVRDKSHPLPLQSGRLLGMGMVVSLGGESWVTC